MKKVLLASTALAFSAGWASADVINTGSAAGATIELDGFAEMGVFGNDLTDDSDLQFHTDIDLQFIFSGQTDGGLEFGANIDLDETDGSERGIRLIRDENGDIEDIQINEGQVVNRPTGGSIRDVTFGGSPAFDNALQGGEEIYIRGAFGALYMGDVDGALDWALTETSIGGSLTDNEENAGWNSNAGLDGFYDGQIARYEYAFGDFAIAASAEIDDLGNSDPILGLGAKYSYAGNGFDMVVGAGVQTISGAVSSVVSGALGDLEDEDLYDSTIWGISGDLSMSNGVQVIASYSNRTNDSDLNDDDGSYYGLAVGYEWDALLVSANWGHFEDWGVIGFDSEGYGLIANYDLGGGAELQAGYSHNTIGETDFSNYSFGVAMNF